MRKISLVVVGTSAGGLAALKRLFRSLPDTFTLPIVVVQHLPASSTIEPNLIFGSDIKSTVREALDKMPIEDRNVYFAPPGYHLLIEKDRTLSLSQDELVNFSRPSIDVLFDSAAASLGEEVCGILMTGANADGALGLKHIGDVGGLTLVQDPEDAETQAMPRAAIALRMPAFVGKVESIAQKLSQVEHGGVLL